MNTLMSASQDDSSLVSECLKGNHDAFRALVERYQSLICALIYSRCGDVAQSEDLAQETFLAAWKSLPTLRETSSFKPWLCQIARNVSANSARVLNGKASAHSTSIDAVPELPDGTVAPDRDAISREEQAIVWQTLERLPENYRLPLILFHREGQAIAEVAQALDLSEDVVRQRLVRGREMLRAGVNEVVEGVLGRTKPGKAFTASVLAGLGAAASSTAKAAGVAVSGANTVLAAKSAFAASHLLGLGVLPLIGDWIIWRMFRAKARTAHERAVFLNYATVMALTDVLFTIWMYVVIHFAPRFERSTVIIVVAASVIGFLGLRWMQIFLTFRKAGWLAMGAGSASGGTSRRGYAPGWQVRCPKCGLTVGAGAAGLIRVGAVGTTRRLGPCSRCNRWRWLIVERSNKEE